MKETMYITIEGVTKKYGRRDILRDVSFTADKGQCIGILGVNGSGKSTLLSILAGVQAADSGSFMYNGDDLLKNSKARSASVGYVPQGTPLIEELSAKDNLLLWYTAPQLAHELEKGVLSLLGIGDFLNTTVSKMSGGMKKRLSIGCSMAGHPRILILDEPSAALDLMCKQTIANYLKLFKESGGTVFIATHDVAELELCDAMYILRDGVLSEFSFDGDVDRLVNNLR